jgi:hypothetical protein
VNAGPTLFDFAADPLPVRSSDPETSKAAARDLPLRARHQEVVDALRLRACSATADEVRQTLREYGFDRERGEVASRLSELERLGIARKVGVRKNHKNRSVATWVLS